MVKKFICMRPAGLVKLNGVTDRIILILLS